MSVIQFHRQKPRYKDQEERVKDGLVKRGKYYHYTRKIDGKFIRRSTKQTTREDAKAWVEKHILAPQREEAIGIRPLTKIEFEHFVKEIYLPHLQATKKHSTYDFYKRKLQELLRYFAGFPLTDITMATLERYKIKRMNDRKKGPIKSTGRLKGSSINKELTALSACCNYAINQGYLKANPVRGVERLTEEAYQANFLSEEDFVNKFLPVANPKGIYGLTELYLLTFYLGLRFGEVSSLKWQNIDFKNRIISIWDTKTNTPRHLPMNDWIEKMLKKLKDTQRSEYVFPNKQGGKWKTVLTGFKAALKRAGLPNMRFHDLRHSFVTNCAAKGISWDKTSLITGHKSFQMYQRYRHFFDRSAREVVESFKAPTNYEAKY